MHVRVGMLSPIAITARHLAKRAPNCRYSANRSRKPSRPSVIFSPGKFAIALAPLSTLMPGMIPCSSSAFDEGATVASLLPNRLVEENYAADKFACAGCSK